MLQRFLFETRLGNRLLAWLERRAGLAVVDAEWLAALGEGYTPVGWKRRE